MRERAEQVAVILVEDGVGHDDVPRLHRIQRQTEDIAGAGMRVVAVGNGRRHVHAIDVLVAVVQRAERRLAEHRDEAVLRRHLILAFHRDVINIPQRRIAVGHKLRPTPAQRRAVAGEVGKTVGDHRRIQVRQAGRSGIVRAGDVKIQIRLGPRRVGGGAGKDAFARDRQRVRDEGDERRVGVAHRIGDDVEMPLVRLADEQQRIGAVSGVGTE